MHRFFHHVLTVTGEKHGAGFRLAAYVPRKADRPCRRAVVAPSGPAYPLMAMLISAWAMSRILAAISVTVCSLTAV
jgi:hypothetical protein